MTELWTVKDCASFLHVSTSKLYQLTAAKVIPFFRVGRKCLFSPEDVLKWLEEHKEKPEKGQNQEET